MLSWQRNPCADCKSAQQCATRGHPYHSPGCNFGELYGCLLPRPKVTSWHCSSVGMLRGTDTQTHTQTVVDTVHFVRLCIIRNVMTAFTRRTDARIYDQCERRHSFIMKSYTRYNTKTQRTKKIQRYTVHVHTKSGASVLCSTGKK